MARAASAMAVMLLAAQQVRADESAVGRRRGDDDLHLVRQLVGQSLLDEQWMVGDQDAFTFHLFAVYAADPVEPVDLGIGQLLARSSFAGGFDLSCLGHALGDANAGGLLRLGFEGALLDLLLLEGQYMLHGFFLAARSNDLLPCRGLGCFLAANLVRL